MILFATNIICAKKRKEARMKHLNETIKRLISAFFVSYDIATNGFHDSEARASMLGEFLIWELLDNNETRGLKDPYECTIFGNEKINVYSIMKQGDTLNIKVNKRKKTATWKINIGDLTYQDRTELFWQLLTESGLNEKYNKRMNKQNELIPLF